MVIPQDLQPVIGKKELRYSLKTGHLSKAKSMARLLAGICQMIFRSLRNDDMKKLKLADRRHHNENQLTC